MNKILSIVCFIVALNNISFAQKPIFFIGTFSENEHDLKQYLLHSSDRWALSKITENILQKELNQLSHRGEFNLILKKDFSKYKDDFSSNARDRRIGFFYLSSHAFKLQHKSINTQNYILLLTLSFVQLGEEPNRMTSQDTFEVRYTSSVNFLSQSASNTPEDIRKLYQNSFKSAVKKLLLSIQTNHSRKEINGLMSNDIFFSLQKFNIAHKIEEKAKKIFGNNKKLKNFLLSLMEESLIRKIRENKELDNVVLLYPISLNKHILKNWAEYVTRINELTRSSLKDKSSQVVVRDIKPICSNRLNHGMVRYEKGYVIQALLAKIDFLKVKQKLKLKMYDANTYVLARVLLPLSQKLQINPKSTVDNIQTEIDMHVGSGNSLYEVYEDTSQRNFEAVKSLIWAVDDLSIEVVDDIKKIVEIHKQNINLELFCKEN